MALRVTLVLWVCCGTAGAQSVAFDLRTAADCPVSLVGQSASTIRVGRTRREFVTVKNVSGRGAAALIFQQTVSDGEKEEIVAIERISVVFGAHETKRLSVGVDDVWSRVRREGKLTGKPVLTVVAVEFLDGTTWSAPVDRAER
jgi:hypothetical protein